MIITLLRKPLEGTVAENTLKHGCGAINIDATRISTSDNLNGGAYAENPTERGGQDMWTSTRKGDSNCFQRGGAGEYEQPTGRWPSNFILTHLEGCELRGTKKVKGHKNSNRKTNQGFGENGIYGKTSPTTLFDYTDKEGKEEVMDWVCVEGCPVKALDKQTGILVSGKDVNPTSSNVSGFFGKKDNYYSAASNYGDSGGASRFFKQFKKVND